MVPGLGLMNQLGGPGAMRQLLGGHRPLQLPLARVPTELSRGLSFLFDGAAAPSGDRVCVGVHALCGVLCGRRAPR